MEQIDEFLKSSKARLQVILDKFQWTAEGVLEDFNTNCEIDRKAEFTSVEDDESPFPPSITARNSIVLDEAEFRRLLNNPNAKVPQKFSDLQLNFSREEKLLLYEHTIAQRTEMDPLASQQDDIISMADIVAMKKLEKKKRRKYRTSKPSYVEELHGLLEIQMQALEQYFVSKTQTRSKEESQTGERNSRKYSEREPHASYQNTCPQKTYKHDRNNRNDNLSTEHYFDRRSSCKKSHQNQSRESSTRRYTEERTHRRRSRSSSRHKSHRHRHKSRSSSRQKHRRHHKRSRSRSRDRNKREHKTRRSRSRQRNH